MRHKGQLIVYDLTVFILLVNKPSQRHLNNLLMENFIRRLITAVTILLVACFATPAREITPSEFLDACKERYTASSNYYLIETRDSLHWTMFVDPAPSAMWGHDCHIVRTLKVTDSQNPDLLLEEFPMQFPSSNRMTLLYAPPKPENQSPRHVTATDINELLNNNGTEAINEYAQRTYAIILSGGVNLNSNRIGAWNSCSLAYRMLRNRFGVPKDHIIPLLADGDNPALDTLDDTERINIYTGDTLSNMNKPHPISQSLDLGLDGVNVIKLAATKENLYDAFQEIA